MYLCVKLARDWFCWLVLRHLGEGTLSWENVSLRFAYKQVFREFPWLMIEIDVDGLSSMRVVLALGRSSCMVEREHSLCFSSFLQVPVLTPLVTECDLRAVSWNRPWLWCLSQQWKPKAENIISLSFLKNVFVSYSIDGPKLCYASSKIHEIFVGFAARSWKFSTYKYV